ncbi:hypothetical protein [Bacillus sp. ISTL8]|uniref:hypothetical protein n=1 Tax=Bacillus sp. ISTL8 TaxID=2596896 RepID=UPI001456E89C|nr:hypothetical protein [Bacillus sp. ISTL8]
MVVDYNQIMVKVIAKDDKQMNHYFKLFKFMLGEDKITKVVKRSGLGCSSMEVNTDKIKIEFFVGMQGLRGHRAHYVINLIQNERFHHEVALPMTNIWSLLDPKQYPELVD